MTRKPPPHAPSYPDDVIAAVNLVIYRTRCSGNDYQTLVDKRGLPAVIKLASCYSSLTRAYLDAIHEVGLPNRGEDIL